MSMETFSRSLLTVTCLALLAACGRAPPERPDAQTTDTRGRVAETRQDGCQLISAAEMTEILGAAVKAEPMSPDNSTDCNYVAADGAMPMAQLDIDRGSAEAAMTATGMLGQMEPGMTNPYEGLGDQAAAIGPAVWIRRGEDLVMITIMGVDAHDATVRRVYELVDSRLR
jgi:hypothetical protein